MLNFLKNKLAIVLMAVTMTVSACASTPVIRTKEAANHSQRHVVYSFYVKAGGNQQLMSMIWDRATGSYEMKVASENETFIRAVVESMVSNWGPAIIGGVAGIQIARDGKCSGSCGGTVIWNDGSSTSVSASGAIATSDANANAVARIRGAHGHGNGSW